MESTKIIGLGTSDKKCLNLGSGNIIIPNVDSLDVNPEFKTTYCFDMRTADPWPINDESYDEVYMFHTIEHIEKDFHAHVYKQIRRILKADGIFILSFPEFEIILRNWLDNDKGMRTFWEANIYGLQRSNSDYHLCAMDSTETRDNLINYGFKNVEIGVEQAEYHNTIVRCKKGELRKTYEHVVYEDVVKQ